MKKRMLLACALLWAGASASAPRALTPAPETGRFLMTSFSGGQPLWAWCDSPSRVLALIQYAVPATTNPQTTPAELHEWPKTAAGLGKIQVSTVLIGQPDPGAGQIYTPLKLTSGPRKGQSGYVHTSNIENTNDPAYRMTKTGEFKLGNDVYKCRYVKDATFIGVTQKRTVIIWDNGKTATYATRNFDGSAGVYVTGGKNIDFGSETGWGYEFLKKEGYKYSVSSGDGMRPKQPPLSVTVYRKGKVLTDEPFLAYSISLPK
ncbi:hypothetical protein WDJ50_16885 [Deinococcus sp. VB142]|uniref:Phosphodiester glycosidase domain-containing protein n=1 Tax=Deinococcus sp. VB142 TaxID=3112952 RepID=A0AAU6Q633_9DEIO